MFKDVAYYIQDNVFQFYGKCPDKQQFIKTVDTFPGYIDKNRGYPKDVESFCKKHKLSTIRDLVDLPGEEKNSDTKNLIWKTHIQMYVWRVKTQENNC